MTGSEGLLTSYAAERRMLEGCMYTTKQRRCILSAYTLKELQTQAWGDASRIIKGWPTSAESLYDAFSKTSAKSCAHLLHSAYFWHSLTLQRWCFICLLWSCNMGRVTLLSHCRELTAFLLQSLQQPLFFSKEISQQEFSLLCRGLLLKS